MTSTPIGRVLDADKPVVTINSESHVTVGSHFVERGLSSEAEGDRPGSLAAPHEDAIAARQAIENRVLDADARTRTRTGAGLACRGAIDPEMGSR